MKYVKAIYVQLTRADVDRLDEISNFMKEHHSKTVLPSDVHFLLALLERDPAYLKFWRDLEQRGKIPEVG